MFLTVKILQMVNFTIPTVSAVKRVPLSALWSKVKKTVDHQYKIEGVNVMNMITITCSPGSTATEKQAA